LVVTLTACGTSPQSSPGLEGSADATESSTAVSAGGPSLDNLVDFTAKSVDAGGVEVVIQPDSVSEAGATFTISLNTHSVELSMDPAAIARLEVGGIEWPVDSWDGDPAGGHHRSGILSFSAAGAVEGKITIELEGFPAPISFTWQLGA